MYIGPLISSYYVVLKKINIYFNEQNTPVMDLDIIKEINIKESMMHCQRKRSTILVRNTKGNLSLIIN